MACALIAVLALGACGKYGPPVRTIDKPPGALKATPAAVSAPATSDAERCNDPNAAPTEAKP
ncbi:MAG TPA: hypothetical protein VKF60_10500 [Myxococcota bacterium]|nr:hypothetical protein [Myxococcota bacterium]